jgi:hypothetical protein
LFEFSFASYHFPLLISHLINYFGVIKTTSFVAFSIAVLLNGKIGVLPEYQASSWSL